MKLIVFLFLLTTISVNAQWSNTGDNYTAGSIIAKNPNNTDAVSIFSWQNNIARVRIGGSGSGASNGFIFQGVGDYTLLRLLNNGNVGIGTTTPDSKLTVKGKVHAEEVKVDLSVPGPDYVFKENYKLKTLEEVQNYIKENGHLPNIPSAKEMETNGVELGIMNMKLLEKIEELTLYILLQEKEIDSMKKDIEQLKNK